MMFIIKTKQHLAGVCKSDQLSTAAPGPGERVHAARMEWTCYLCKIQGKTNTEDETKCAYFFFRCEYKSARVRGVLAAAVCELSPGAASCLRGRRGENARTRHLLLFRTHQLLQLRSRNRLDRVRQARVPTLQVRECLFRCLSVISVCVNVCVRV